MAAVNSTTARTEPHRGVELNAAGALKSTDHELQEVEHVDQRNDGNLLFEEEEVEPELHARTWIALAAMHLLVFTQVLALQGPPAVVRSPSDPRVHNILKARQLTHRHS